MNESQSTGLVWRKSSFSGGNGGQSCVEVAPLANGGRAVRDSKNPNGGMLNFTADEWSAFLAGAKDGQFD